MSDRSDAAEVGFHTVISPFLCLVSKRIDAAAHGDVALEVAAGEDYSFAGTDVNHFIAGLNTSADHLALSILVDVGNLVFHQNLYAFLFAVGFKRHYDAASAHKAAGRLRFTVAVAGIVGVDVQVKLVVLTVVLAGFGCGRKELNAVGFKLFLSGTAILRVFLQESGDVLFVLGILGIREVSIKAFGRIGYTVFTLPLCAALKCHDAAVDNGCTTVVLAFFKDDGCQQRRWRHTCRQCRSQLQQRLLSYPIWMACAEDRASERQKRERQSLQVRMRLRRLKTNGGKIP